MFPLNWRWQKVEVVDIVCATGVLFAFSQMVYADSIHDETTALCIAMILLGLGLILANQDYAGGSIVILAVLSIIRIGGHYAFNACAWVLGGILLGYVLAFIHHCFVKRR